MGRLALCQGPSPTVPFATISHHAVPRRRPSDRPITGYPGAVGHGAARDIFKLAKHYFATHFRFHFCNGDAACQYPNVHYFFLIAADSYANETNTWIAGG